MDESHEICGQLMGVLFVSSKVISAHALYWKSQTDRLVAIEARTFVIILKILQFTQKLHKFYAVMAFIVFTFLKH